MLLVAFIVNILLLGFCIVWYNLYQTLGQLSFAKKEIRLLGVIAAFNALILGLAVLARYIMPEN
ncbi:hypothetical protein GCM10023187_48430 [Nibrella viscosa]|uniref:Uncharacterized protein n=1 Tax=Nibrella viscosa TaxID=1084524 RepID=A0ABP8KVJ7_9BACT